MKKTQFGESCDQREQQSETNVKDANCHLTYVVNFTTIVYGKYND
jgi:hypothetical protein